MGTVILACDCKHQYQDQRYGAGRRVHNRCRSKGVQKSRCTVCGKEK